MKQQKWKQDKFCSNTFKKKTTQPSVSSRNVRQPLSLNEELSGKNGRSSVDSEAKAGSNAWFT